MDQLQTWTNGVGTEYSWLRAVKFCRSGGGSPGAALRRSSFPSVNRDIVNEERGRYLLEQDHFINSSTNRLQIWSKSDSERGKCTGVDDCAKTSGKD
jgi:hypothetical protein